MADRREHAHRPLYACDACDIVYARHSAPNQCRVCENESFLEVVPREHPS